MTMMPMRFISGSCRCQMDGMGSMKRVRSVTMLKTNCGRQWEMYSTREAGWEHGAGADTYGAPPQRHQAVAVAGHRRVPGAGHGLALEHDDERLLDGLQGQEDNDGAVEHGQEAALQDAQVEHGEGGLGRGHGPAVGGRADYEELAVRAALGAGKRRAAGNDLLSTTCRRRAPRARPCACRSRRSVLRGQ